jgi:hypothetical protein
VLVVIFEKRNAAAFAISGLLILISLSYAIASGFSIAMGNVDDWRLYLTTTMILGLVGMYNAFRALQLFLRDIADIKKNQSS